MRVDCLALIVGSLGVLLVWYYLASIYKEVVRLADRERQVEGELVNLYDLTRRAVDFYKANFTSGEVKRAVYVEATKTDGKRKKDKKERDLLEGLE